jgi:membrane-bound lytic murein transglycosylase D
MNKLMFSLYLLFCITSNGFSQNTTQDTLKIKVSYLDSIKKTFVNHKISDKVDKLWFNELQRLDIYKDLITDIETINPDTPVDFELPTELLKQRLKLMDEKSPFNIEYNQGLENVIKSFLKNRKSSFERLMGVSQYYFPMFEEALAKYNIPLEIKYLAVVESALNSKARSRMGATGLWQFMFQTGKQYNLKIDSYIDERSDALKSSDAAARYMQKMYEIFKDWDLVLASYNSGPGNVSKAIRRSGGLTNYWNIRSKLPRETQGYVPAFLATMYIFEYHKEHGIKPNAAIINPFSTDTIAIKNKMTFKQIADLLDIPESEIEFLNPSYKLNVIPYVQGNVNFLRLPIDKIAIFTSNESKMYAYANYEFDKREKPYVKPVQEIASTEVTTSKAESQPEQTENTTATKQVKRTKFHIVKNGDNLSTIADKYNVSLSDLKKWNHLKKDIAQKNKKLKIIYTETIVVASKTKNNNLAISKTESKQEVAQSNTKIDSTTKNEKTNEYTVKPGDNLYFIATIHKTTVEELRRINNLSEDKIVYAGDKIIISKDTELKKDTKTITYVVKKGDNLSLIASKHAVSMEDLKMWNDDIVDNDVKVGQKLTIEKEVSNQKRIASKIKTKNELFKLYTVKNGDSLYSISQKHNVTIAEIKKLNNIKNDNIIPGMKLKING